MGMFTRIIHPIDRRELQIKTGDDNLGEYRVGDTVNWSIDNNYPGEGTLLDGVYHAISNIGEKYVYDWVIIKNHIIKEVVSCSDDISYKSLAKKYNIKSYNKKWWSQKEWRNKRKKDDQNKTEYDLDMKKYKEEIDYINLSKQDQLGAMIVYPIRRCLKYESIGRKIFNVEKIS